MIEAHGLCMEYGSVQALRDASFEVARGEVVGLLGPNGAGKSTTMKILTTYLWPTRGTARVNGKSVTEDPIAVRQAIGYLPEVLPLYQSMEVGEYLRFVGEARGVTGKRLQERTEYVVERCKLKEMFRRPIRQLSKGYRQRAGLAQALLHDPEVLILDEPTSGLDPRQILDVRALVRELADNKTVILSTHILQEAEAMADRIIIINQGRIVGQGTLQELRRQAHDANRVHFAVHAGSDEVDKALGAIPALRARSLREKKDGWCSWTAVGPDEQAMVDALGKLASEKHWQVTELSGRPYSLEETFLALTGATATAGAKVQGGAA